MAKPINCTPEKNAASCTCTYDGCPRRGKCCECVTYHRAKEQLPGCFFSKEGEKSYDRSYQHFIADNSRSRPFQRNLPTSCDRGCQRNIIRL